MFSRLPSTVRAALGLLFLSLALCACGPKITAPPEPPLAVRLGDDAFRLQDYEAAIDDYGVYIDSVEHGEYTPFAFYQTALCWYRLEQYEVSLDTIAELSRRYPDEHWAQVDALRGDAQYKLGRRTAALIVWDQGWSHAKPSEKPEFRRRIVNVLREMDEAELTEASQIVESSEVVALVDHHLAIERQDRVGVSAPAPAAAPPPAPVPPKEVAAAAKEAPPSSPAIEEEEEGTTVAEAVLGKESEPDRVSADTLALEAEAVANRAEEAERLSDEVDVTGEDVFAAVRETEQARGQIAEVETSMAAFAPLTKVEIPEPPFVDRPVPEPKTRIGVASPSESRTSGAEQVVAVAEQPVEGVEKESVIAPIDAEELQPVTGPLGEMTTVSGEAEPKVACVLPLTGADRTFGESILRSVRLVFAAGSDRVVFRDSGSDPESARRLVAELSADDEVLIAIVPAAGANAHSMARSAENAAVPVLLLSPTTVPKSRYVMRIAPGGGAEQGGFANSYRERYGSAPDAVNAQAYQAALLAREALEIAPVPREDVLSRIAVQGGLGQVGTRLGHVAEDGNREAIQVAVDNPR